MADVIRMRGSRYRRSAPAFPDLLRRLRGGRQSWLAISGFLGAAAVIFAMSTPAFERSALGFGSSGADLAKIAGKASVIDGDTLAIQGKRIRLYGIDAPESSQSCKIGGRNSRCGWRAARELESKIAGRTVTCHQKSLDQYDRIVAVCAVGGEELNGWMVQNGQAVAYTLFTEDYVLHEAEASAAQRGIWKGKFVSPWDWRKGARL